MKKMRQCGGRADGDKEEERGGDEESILTTGSSGILQDLDIDGGGGVGRGVVLEYSSSARGWRTSRARVSSRGGTMTGNCDDNGIDNENDNARTPQQGLPRYGGGLEGNHPPRRLGVILPPLSEW